jgi:hypothetical protein
MHVRGEEMSDLPRAVPRRGLPVNADDLARESEQAGREHAQCLGPEWLGKVYAEAARRGPAFRRELKRNYCPCSWHRAFRVLRAVWWRTTG